MQVRVIMAEYISDGVFQVKNEIALLNLSWRLANGSGGLIIYKNHGRKLPELDDFLELCKRTERFSLKQYDSPPFNNDDMRQPLEQKLNTHYAEIIKWKTGLTADKIPDSVILEVGPIVLRMYEFVNAMYLFVAHNIPT